MPSTRADRPARAVKGSPRATLSGHVIDLGTGALTTAA
jgi:hypothetical protein